MGLLKNLADFLDPLRATLAADLAKSRQEADALSERNGALLERNATLHRHCDEVERTNSIKVTECLDLCRQLDKKPLPDAEEVARISSESYHRAFVECMQLLGGDGHLKDSTEMAAEIAEIGKRAADCASMKIMLTGCEGALHAVLQSLGVDPESKDVVGAVRVAIDASRPRSDRVAEDALRDLRGRITEAMPCAPMTLQILLDGGTPVRRRRGGRPGHGETSVVAPAAPASPKRARRAPKKRRSRA